MHGASVRPWRLRRNGTYCICPGPYSVTLLKRLRPTYLRVVPPTVGRAFLHQSSIRKMTTGQSDGGIFLRQGFLFPNDSSSYQIYEKTNRPSRQAVRTRTPVLSGMGVRKTLRDLVSGVFMCKTESQYPEMLKSASECVFPE